MANYYEAKVCYERQADDAGMKRVSELYLVDALSFTEAEERVVKEVRPNVSVGELDVVNIRRRKIAELLLSRDSRHDRYYRAKVAFVTIDERTGAERATSVAMIVQSDTLINASSSLASELDKQLGTYRIESISETPIMDVYLYQAEGAE